MSSRKVAMAFLLLKAEVRPNGSMSQKAKMMDVAICPHHVAHPLAQTICPDVFSLSFFIVLLEDRIFFFPYPANAQRRCPAASEKTNIRLPKRLRIYLPSSSAPDGRPPFSFVVSVPPHFLFSTVPAPTSCLFCFLLLSATLSSPIKLFRLFFVQLSKRKTRAHRRRMGGSVLFVAFGGGSILFASTRQLRAEGDLQSN
mmetsp:Transcript_78223/g.162424  ORF Transcript_78223/g.162424 Transcript_78223/m.162424 type:complete len:199 (+) Transcript_78223:358-954(+)